MVEWCAAAMKSSPISLKGSERALLSWWEWFGQVESESQLVR